MFQRVALWALVVFVGWAAPALRADEPTGRPFVLVVGIDQYKDPQIKSRPHAEADARAVYDFFLAKQNLGVEKDHAKLLLGSGPSKDYPAEVATRANILKAFRWLEKSAKKDDLVIVAVFANGAPLGERSCYFAVDSTFKNRAKDAVASGDIEHIIDKLASHRFVAFVDVHFLGFNVGKEKAPDSNSRNFYREFLSQGDETKDPQPSRVLFIANSGTKPSLDLAKHGIFAQVLLDGLQGKADSAGYEPDGNIMVSELAKYFRKTLPERAQKDGTTETQKQQKGGVVEGQTTDFVVAYHGAVRAKTQERLKKFAALTRGGKLDAKLVEEGRNLLSSMPKLVGQQDLRKAYQRFADGKTDLDSLAAERKNVLDSMVLSETDARRFATTIMNAVGLVRRTYYKDVVKGPLIENAVAGLFKGIEEKLPAHLKEQVGKAKEMTDADLYRLLTDARQQLGKREDLDKGQDITYALNGMLAKLDRHTGYIPPEVVRRFRDDTAGSFKGIGVQIRRHDTRDQLQVVTPIFGSPAHKAGLKANDIITTIISEVDPQSGAPYEKPKITSTKGMATEGAVKLIQGKAGTRVKLLVEREGVKKPIEFTLIRNTIEVESVLGYKRAKDDSWNYVIDPDNKICYVRLTQFSENTYSELEKVMRDLYKAGIKGFILDLRFNPGGVLDGSIKIADLFIDDGLIVTVRHRGGKETSYVGRADGSYTTFPMVCLINSGSASASEIVSACLQDHGRAIIMGSRSFGKGSVQTIHGFDHQSILKVTTATFWRPNNRNLNKASTKGRDVDEWGVTPDKDFNLKLPKKEENDLFDHLRESEIIRAGPSTTKSDFRDRQLDMAVDYLRGQIRTASRRDAKRAAQNR
ncbi:MAG: PDZ domain-containing protein [Planctomycetes bacterium]|nr:PDZ domain-containing protein [Planctomycetota bacterium]